MEVINWLAQHPEKQVFFLTNSSGRTRDDYVEKVRKMGWKGITREMVYGSAYITARYLQEKHPEIKKVRVLGMNSICKEMAEVGIQSCGGEDDEGFKDGRVMTIEDFENYTLDKDVSAVVVGLDIKFTYSKLCIATLYIHTGGAKFIACNDDAYDMVGGKRSPGAGFMISSLKTILSQHEEQDGVSSHRQPIIIAKPNPYVIELIQKERNVKDKSRMIMIGDRLDTDILLAHNAGIDGCLVFTGVIQSQEDMYRTSSKDKLALPKYCM